MNIVYLPCCEYHQIAVLDADINLACAENFMVSSGAININHYW